MRSSELAKKKTDIPPGVELYCRSLNVAFEDYVVVDGEVVAIWPGKREGMRIPGSRVLEIRFCMEPSADSAGDQLNLRETPGFVDEPLEFRTNGDAQPT
jgi:hypothetical protein